MAQINLKDFNTEQIMVPQKNPFRDRWVIGIDVGYSGVKAMAPDKWFFFPSFVKKVENRRMITEENDIYYRDQDGLFLVGEQAQEQVLAGDTNDSSAAFARDRYYSREFVILARTAVAVGMMGSDGNCRPYIQTGLPAAYLKEDAPKIRSAFTMPGEYEVRVGSGKWMKYRADFRNGDISVISQPTGTLNSILFDDAGEDRPDARHILEKNILIADFGFGTFDPYGILHGKRALEESFNGYGMKRILEVASGYIYSDYHTDIRIPQMRKYLRKGYANLVDIQAMSSRKIDLAPYISRACAEVADLAVRKLYETAGYFQDYNCLIVTGGTGAAWYEIIKEKLKNMEGLTILPGNDGNQLPMYLSNVRGYYMHAYRQLQKAAKTA